MIFSFQGQGDPGQEPEYAIRPKTVEGGPGRTTDEKREQRGQRPPKQERRTPSPSPQGKEESDEDPEKSGHSHQSLAGEDFEINAVRVIDGKDDPLASNLDLFRKGVAQMSVNAVDLILFIAVPPF